MNYTEKKSFTEKYKQEYVDGIEAVINKRQKQAEKIRDEYAKNIFETPEKYREDFKEMLGWPLVGYENNELPKAEMEKLSDEDGYSIYRMQFEVLEGPSSVLTAYKNEKILLENLYLREDE